MLLAIRGLLEGIIPFLGVFGVEIDGLLPSRKLPCDQVLLTVVLGGLAIPCLCAEVDDLDDLVDKDDDLILQALGCVRELPDSAH